MTSFFILNQIKVDLAIFDQVGEMKKRFGILVRMKTCKQIVKCDSKGPNIYFLVVLLSQQNLRRHIQRRSTRLLLALLSVEESSEAKVSDLDVKIFLRCHKNIRGLHVSVHDSQLMHEVQPKKYLLDNDGSLLFLKCLDFFKSILQVTSWKKFAY